MLQHLPEIRARVRSDFQQESPTGFISDPEIDRWANEGYYKYAIRLMLASQGYFETTSNLDITNGQEAIALPYNFLNDRSLQKMVRVERVLPTVRVPLNYRKRFSESNPTSGVSGGQSFLPSYDFRGNSLIIEPTPSFTEANAGGTAGLRIVYAALPPKLISGAPQAIANGSITLDATADPRDDYYVGSKIYIVSGTGIGQVRTITDYVGSTQVATIDSVWTLNPTVSSIYSTLIHDDFPESFHDLIPLFATKMAFNKERSFGSARAYDALDLKEKEKEFIDFTANKTTARQFVEPFHPELY